MSETTLKATIQDDLHTAMRERDQVRAGTLRMALAAITNAEVAGDTAKELSDDETLKVVAKEAKKRKEAIEAYQGAGREDLAAKESAELVVLEAYLPAQLSDEEIAAIVDAVVTKVDDKLGLTYVRFAEGLGIIDVARDQILRDSLDAGRAGTDCE
mgnify:CR=1 FL=1